VQKGIGGIGVIGLQNGKRPIFDSHPNSHGHPPHGELHPQKGNPPARTCLKSALHSPEGHTPTQIGIPGLPHGVLPVGMQPQSFRGKGVSDATQCSPAGQTPLHAGAVSPQGEVDEMQVQTSSASPLGLHTASGAQVPLHSGAGVLPHGIVVLVVDDEVVVVVEGPVGFFSDGRQRSGGFWQPPARACSANVPNSSSTMTSDPMKSCASLIL